MTTPIVLTYSLWANATGRVFIQMSMYYVMINLLGKCFQRHIRSQVLSEIQILIFDYSKPIITSQGQSLILANELVNITS